MGIFDNDYKNRNINGDDNFSPSVASTQNIKRFNANQFLIGFQINSHEAEHGHVVDVDDDHLRGKSKKKDGRLCKLLFNFGL